MWDAGFSPEYKPLKTFRLSAKVWRMGSPTIRLKTARIASAAQARQRLRRPSLRSGPPGDPHGPLRLKQHLGPEGALPARQDGPETS